MARPLIIVALLVTAFLFYVRRDTFKLDYFDDYTYKIENVERGTTCSAFALKSSKDVVYIITAGHCVQEAQAFLLTNLSTKQRHIVNLIEFKAEGSDDWAVLTAPKELTTGFIASKKSSMSILQLTWFSSIYGSTPIADLLIFNNTVYFRGKVVPGESGSPIFGENKTVIGIVTFTFISTNIGGGVPIYLLPQDYL